MYGNNFRHMNIIVVFITLDRLYEQMLTYIGKLTFTLSEIKVNDDKLEYPTKEYSIIQVKNIPNQDTTIYAYTRKGLRFEETIL
jgi:hypothetical protein